MQRAQLIPSLSDWVALRQHLEAVCLLWLTHHDAGLVRGYALCSAVIVLSRCVFCFCLFSDANCAEVHLVTSVALFLFRNCCLLSNSLTFQVRFLSLSGPFAQAMFCSEIIRLLAAFCCPEFREWESKDDDLKTRSAIFVLFLCCVCFVVLP